MAAVDVVHVEHLAVVHQLHRPSRRQANTGQALVTRQPASRHLGHCLWEEIEEKWILVVVPLRLRRLAEGETPFGAVFEDGLKLVVDGLLLLLAGQADHVLGFLLRVGRAFLVGGGAPRVQD